MGHNLRLLCTSCSDRRNSIGGIFLLDSLLAYGSAVEVRRSGLKFLVYLLVCIYVSMVWA
jgi:hypothetical protein